MDPTTTGRKELGLRGCRVKKKTRTYMVREQRIGEHRVRSAKFALYQACSVRRTYVDGFQIGEHYCCAKPCRTAAPAVATGKASSKMSLYSK